MTSNEKSQFIEIFPGTPFQAEMVKNLLENAGIKVFLRDGFLGAIAPWWASPGGAGAVKVFVSNTDFEQANEVVNQYEANLKLE
ncbi:MAG: hypothetical protein CVT92_03160 [Bacteroidetes bacterium HGW-Bacteroidetes-1]|jgi:hypothetical protein|nr:MAG: hypothetical protein CVT92_03160 [Bacteroidetes bacterium HGW-Bacteroidetes-1]